MAADKKFTIPSKAGSAPSKGTSRTGWERWKYRNRDTIEGYLFLLPFLIPYLIFTLFPVMQAGYMSLFKWDLLAMGDRSFIGLDNYVKMMWGKNIVWDLGYQLPWRLGGLAVVILSWWAVSRKRMEKTTAAWITAGAIVLLGGIAGIHPAADGGRWNDAIFWKSFGNTLQFVLLSTPLIVGIGLLTALALNGSGRLLGLFRTLFFTPYILSVSVVTLIWGYVLNPQRGILAAFLSNFGIEPIPWLTNADLALPAIVFTTLWWTMGFNMVLFLAGLQDIEPALYEAADLDGAGAWGKFRYITVPGLRRTLLLVVILQVIASFQIFGQVYIMTRGGPAGSTRVLVQHIYESGFRDFSLGYASAMSIFLFFVMLIISFLQLQLTQEEE
jgi:multiple sugar transport system permease protein